MIATLRGYVTENDLSQVVVECGGVGYGLTLCPDDQALLKIGKEVKLYIAEHIKEDSHELYAFMEHSRKNLYLQLTSVNGVGPKAGMALLAIGSEAQVRQAIASGDVAFLSRAVGVGKKVAERVVVDLKNKVGLIENPDATSFLSSDAISDNDEAVLALTALGYALSDAKLVLGGIDKSLPLEDRVQTALRGGVK